jgi:hypothetical protein
MEGPCKASANCRSQIPERYACIAWWRGQTIRETRVGFKISTNFSTVVFADAEGR